MVPSELQSPLPLSALSASSVIVCASPPETLIFFSFRSATKPRYWLSGDQNGLAASSVPGNMVACWALSGRSHRLVFPFSSTAENASVLPSGETTTGPASKPDARNAVPGGGGPQHHTHNG